MSTSENLTLYNLNDRNEMDLWLFKALDLADERRIWVWAVGCELGPCTSKLLLQILKMAQRLGRSSDRSKTQRARGFTRVFRSIPAVGEGHESISGSNRSSISFQFISNVEIMSNCLLPLFFFGLGKRKASISCSRRFFFRALSIAAAGSGLLYAESNSDYNATVSLSVPAPLSESLSLPWTFHLIPLRPSFTSPDNWHFGILPLFSSRVSPVPSTDREKECPGVAGDSSKPSCGCLGRDTIANAAARVGPAVVNLSVPQGFYGITTGKSIGSGTIIDSDGTILTCAHVVVDFQGMRGSSKGKVDVTLQDGRTFEGTVVNADLHSDIAIVKIKSKTPLPTAKLGSSSKLRPGDWVLAMGCPLSLQNTVTAGIVSCVDRKSSDLGLGGMRREYLQTDCAINAGNSGGPLVNVDGQVVGVNIMKVLAADGLSFAVPIDSVIKIIEHFKKSGRVVRPWLGLKMIDLNEMIIAQLKERDPRFPNVDRGVLVPMVTPGSPADRAGFHPGDVVIEFDGKPVESIKEIIEIMGDRVGIPLKTVVKRPNDILVTLTVIPEEANPDM